MIDTQDTIIQTHHQRAVLANHLAGRDNNLNLIRVIAASAVLVSHSFPIVLGRGTIEPLELVTGMSLGGLSVAVFFALSGLLISNSFERRPDLVRFVVARVLRLFPGLLVALAVTVVAGMALTTLEPSAYLLSPQTVAYIPRNLTLAFLQYELPGIFLDNAYPKAINGSLWTLFYEVICYAGVLVAGVLGLLRRKRVFSIFFVAISSIYFLSLDWAPTGGIERRIDLLVTLSFPFSLGMLAYVWRDTLHFDWKPLAALGIMTSIASYSEYAPIFSVITLTYAVGWLAFEIKGRILKFNKFGDYSYGIYIYAFPVQQSFALFFPEADPYINIALSFPVTLVLAIFSWHVVEKRALAHINNLASVLHRIATRPRS